MFIALKLHVVYLQLVGNGQCQGEADFAMNMGWWALGVAVVGSELTVLLNTVAHVVEVDKLLALLDTAAAAAAAAVEVVVKIGYRLVALL